MYKAPRATESIKLKAISPRPFQRVMKVTQPSRLGSLSHSVRGRATQVSQHTSILNFLHTVDR